MKTQLAMYAEEKSSILENEEKNCANPSQDDFDMISILWIRRLTICSRMQLFLITTTGNEQENQSLARKSSFAARDGYLRRRKYPSSYSFHRLFAVRKIVFFVEKTKLLGLLDDITKKIDDNSETCH